MWFGGSFSLPPQPTWGGGGLQCQHLLSFCLFRNSQSSRRGKPSPHPTPPPTPGRQRPRHKFSSKGAAAGLPLELQGVTPTGHLPQTPSSPRDCTAPARGLVSPTVYVASSKPGAPACTLQPPLALQSSGGGLWLWPLCVCWPPGTLFPVHPQGDRGRCLSF